MLYQRENVYHKVIDKHTQEEVESVYDGVHVFSIKFSCSAKEYEKSALKNPYHLVQASRKDSHKNIYTSLTAYQKDSKEQDENHLCKCETGDDSETWPTIKEIEKMIKNARC